jgi:hypothetical protein
MGGTQDGSEVFMGRLRSQPFRKPATAATAATKETKPQAVRKSAERSPCEQHPTLHA